jgi:uncharacterized protein YgiM (DUF1202 family)
MQTKSRNKIIITSIIAAAALAIFWRITKRKKEKEKDQSQPIIPFKPIEIPVGGGSSSIDLAQNTYQTMTVSTTKSNLNVRNNPSETATVIASLPKDAKIFARPSTVYGWHEYSVDGISTSGYVSSKFVK